MRRLKEWIQASIGYTPKPKEQRMVDNRKFQGPTVGSIDIQGARYVLQYTGSTTNVRLVCPSVSTQTIQDAFVGGQQGPDEGYTPPEDLRVSVQALRDWQSGKKKQRSK